MQVLENYYLKGINSHINTERIHDLKINFDKILPIINETLHDQLNEQNNLQFYPNTLPLLDSHIIALALLQEAMAIDRENWFWSKVQTDYCDPFPKFPHRTRYNHRRRRLAGWIEKLARLWSRQIRPAEDTYLVDSIPVPVAHIAREGSTRICCEHFHSAPDKGYSASLGQYYIGYKLHMLVSLEEVSQNMGLTKASVHDVHYLKNIKKSGLSNCLLLADRGYLSARQQTDLFYSAAIELPRKRRIQRDWRPWPKLFKNARRRIETVFSQLCDPLMLKRNYAKTFSGLRARMISKVASFTLLQYINHLHGKPINQVKHALAI